VDPGSGRPSRRWRPITAVIYARGSAAASSKEVLGPSLNEEIAGATYDHACQSGGSRGL